MVKQQSEAGPKGEKVGQRRSSTLRVLSAGLFLHDFLHQHHQRKLANVLGGRHSQPGWLVRIAHQKKYSSLAACVARVGVLFVLL